jgi:hypothetical protein
MEDNMRWISCAIVALCSVARADSGAARASSALDREAVVKTMTAIRPSLDACYAKLRVAGVAMLNLTIAPDGSVAAEIAPKVGSWGDFSKESPTGMCIVDAVQKARFPSFEGPPQKISYPIVLGNEAGRSTDQSSLSPASMETLQRAQDAYAAGKYSEAIALAQRVKSEDPQRALRVIGASSCFLKDAHGAAAAWRELTGTGRKFVEYVCANNKVRLETP